MQQGQGISAALPRAFPSPAIILDTRLRHWDTAGGGGARNWSQIRVLGARDCWSLPIDQSPPLCARSSALRNPGSIGRSPSLPKHPPLLLLMNPPRIRRSTAGPLRRPLQLACFSLSSFSGGFFETCAGGGGSGTAGLMGAAIAAVSTGVMRDLGAACFSIAGAYCLVFVFDNLVKRRLVGQALSRKLVHVLSGVLFLLTWPMFSSSPEARFFAAVVPLLNCLRLLVYGLAVVKDDALIKSVTRHGRREELLRGPLYYVLALLLAVLVFWRESPVGLLALCMMSGGDGFADIVGRRFGAAKLPFNEHKSWVGSVSMFVFGFAISLGMLYYYWTLGFLPSLDWEGGAIMLKVAFIALAATAVESLPLTGSIDDNVSVPLTSMLAAMLAFGP